MDAMRGLQKEPGMGGVKWDPNGPPPPESEDPDFKGGPSTESLRGRGKQRAAPAPRPHATAGGVGKHAAAAAAARTKSTPAGRCSCDWDTVFIIILAVVLFSFLILDIYAQIVSHSPPPLSWCSHTLRSRYVLTRPPAPATSAPPENAQRQERTRHGPRTAARLISRKKQQQQQQQQGQAGQAGQHGIGSAEAHYAPTQMPLL